MKITSFAVGIFATVVGILVLGIFVAVTLNGRSSNEPPDSERVFYVSRAGNNADGLSWKTAWNELDQIDWDIIVPGDVIYLDGGKDEMIYRTEMIIGQSGTPDQPISIQVSDEVAHRGQVIFFGGRDTLLPYCGQQEYSDIDEEKIADYGIRTDDHDYIYVDGRTWAGISIHGYESSGIRIDRHSTNITMRNMEIYNNGEARQDEDGWSSNGPGVRLAGRDITFQRFIVHDNGQDAFQSLWGKNNLANFRLEQSWLYNGRQHPTVEGQSANYCTHTDGIQIYDGGVVKGITISESIVGPGFTQSILLGQSLNDNGSWADVQDVTIRDVVFTKANDNNVLGYRATNSQNWHLDYVTIYCPNTDSHCLKINNNNHAVTNSIIVDGLITFTEGLNTFEGNCQWQTRGFTLGDEINPEFADASQTDSFSLDDYSVAQGSKCAGSRMTSVQQLLSLE